MPHAVDAGPGVSITWSQLPFGAKVRQLRIEHGLSLRELAGDGMSVAYLSRLERGERRPTSRSAEYLAERLGISAQTLEDGALAVADTPGVLARAELALGSALSREGEDALLDELMDAVRTDPKASVELRWHAAWRIAKRCGDQGKYGEEQDWLTWLVELSAEIDDSRLRARAHVQLARCQLVLGQTDLALASAELAYRLAAGEGLAAHEVAETLMVLVSAETEAGHTAQAVRHVVELLAVVSSGSPVLRTRALWNGAMAHAHADDDEKARELMNEALELLDSRDDVILWLRLRIAALSLHLRLEPLDEALCESLLAQISSALALVGTKRHRQESQLLEARYAFKRGRYERAAELCTVLEAVPLMFGYRDAVQLVILRGQLLVRGGRTQEGVAALKELAEQARAQSNFKLAAEIWEALALALSAPDAGHAPGSA